MDFSILPVLAIVYLFNALDKYVASHTVRVLCHHAPLTRVQG
jgi:hypothetical protein